MRSITLFLVTAAGFGLLLLNPSAAETGSGFDPSRHIDVSEIKPGMHGYGLTVFKGTAIERFEVEVLSIAKNFQPKRDAILIMCDDERFTVAKGVQGVSGSPVFFDDRLAGAMAFGWAFGEEPLYGVTLIRQMLAVQTTGQRHKSEQQEDTARSSLVLDRGTYEDLMGEALLNPEQLQTIARRSGLARRSWSDAAGPMRLLPVTIPVGGLQRSALEALETKLGPLAFETGLAGSGVGALITGARPKLERGSALTIPLMAGDVNGAVLGTVTEVVGDQVYGFGHSWNGNGGSQWPMGTGWIHTFVNRKSISFKLGQMVDVVGTIWADETAAVYGQVGDLPNMIPVDVKVRWDYLDQQETFHSDIADDQGISAILGTLVTINSAAYRGEMPLEHTLRYETTVEFDKVDTIAYANISSGMDVSDLLSDTLEPLLLVMMNPWEKVRLKRLEVSVTIENRDRLYVVKSAELGKRLYQPGETVVAEATLEPLREAAVRNSVSLTLPKDLEDGDYKITVGSFMDYRQGLQKAQPHLFRVFDAAGVQRALQKRLNIARNGLYMTMELPKRGVAIEDEALEKLPGTKAMLLTDKSRQKIISQFGPLLWSRLETDFVVAGKKTFAIKVQRQP